MEIWKSQKRGFPHFHRLGGYDDKNEVPNPKNRTESVKYVPGLKCKTCPRLDTDEVSIGVMVKNNTAEYWLSFHVSG
jgi:hypothetical protein